MEWRDKISRKLRKVWTIEIEKEVCNSAGCLLKMEGEDGNHDRIARLPQRWDVEWCWCWSTRCWVIWCWVFENESSVSFSFCHFFFLDSLALCFSSISFSFLLPFPLFFWFSCFLAPFLSTIVASFRSLRNSDIFLNTTSLYCNTRSTAWWRKSSTSW